MTNTEGVKPVEIIQADRDAAAPIIIVPQNAKKIRDGEMDWNPVVQAFARHRLTHQPDTTGVYFGEPILMPDTAAQPVAWMYTYKGNSDLYHSRRSEFTEANGWTETPLYAQPAAQPVGDVERQNLIARIKYILDQPDAKSRMVSRAHLTNHDLRMCVAALSQHPDPQPQADVVELLENAEGAAQWLDQMADRFEGEWPNTAKHCRVHVNSLRHTIAALSQHPDRAVDQA